MRLRMRFVSVTFALSMLFSVAALAQDASAQKVDQIFSAYNKPGSPGCSLGVIRDGDFVYQKAYGLANLELEFLFRHSLFSTWVRCRSSSQPPRLYSRQSRVIFRLTMTCVNTFRSFPTTVMS